MAYAKQKNPSIQWIFEVYNEGPKRYSDSALLYQYILGFAIKLNNKFPSNGIYESFTIWELTDWLINNYYKYQNELKDIPFKNMSRTNRIAARLDGVRNKVRSLKTLDLIEEKELTKASRGDKETMSLSFTNSGYLLAWIIEGLQEKKRKASNIQICNVLEYNYKDRPTSFDFFASILTPPMEHKYYVRTRLQFKHT